MPNHADQTGRRAMSSASRGRRRIVRAAGFAAVLGVLYVIILMYPQPLFAYELEQAGIVVHATRPIPEAMRGTLDRVRVRLYRSPFVAASDRYDVFICHSPWLFAVFARTHYNVGGVMNYLGRRVFLRESDMDHDRLISPSGKPVAADRPLSYFMAHELTHLIEARTLSPLAFARLPRWVNEGYADYVARDIDLAGALDGFKAGTRELDPAQSGLDLRYQLMVAYALERTRMDARALLESPPDGESIERALRTLDGW
jgi:hypothetical protein